MTADQAQDMAGRPALRIEGVRKSFPVRRTFMQLLRRAEKRRLVALDGVSLDLYPNRTLGIVGESGSGKSTLVKVIVRLVEPDEGAVRYFDQDVLAAKGDELRTLRRRIQLIYQDPFGSLNARLRVGDAILEPAKVHGLIPPGGEKARLSELVEQVGLSPKLVERRPRALSGGQRQRVAIARSIAANPDVILADEVVSALDVSIQAQVLNLLVRMQQELGLSMIFVSHNLPVVNYIADDVAVMYLGRVVEHGPAADLLSNPAHPYTAALLDAQPGPDRLPSESVAVRGEIPSGVDIPSGCRYRTRCPAAQSICAEIDPPAVPISPGHVAYCHFAGTHWREKEPTEPQAD